jgi:hypothetical protein
MPINAGSIKLGHCYATAGGALLKVIDVQGEMISYLIRDKLASPTWNTQKSRAATLQTFALEVAREVPCDWQRA